MARKFISFQFAQYGRSLRNSIFIASILFLGLLLTCTDNPTNNQPESNALWNITTDQSGGNYSASASNALYGASIVVPPNALSNSTNLSMDTVASDLPVPQGFGLLSKVFDLKPDGLLFNKPVFLTLPYVGSVQSQNRIGVFSYLDSSWEELLLKEIDSVSHTITVGTFHLTTLAVFETNQDIPVTQRRFDVLKNGFRIINPDNKNCLGMVSFAKWCFEHTNIDLYSRYDDCTEKVVAEKAQSTVPAAVTDALLALFEFSEITEQRRGERLIRDVNRGNVQILGIYEPTIKHAVLVYAYDNINGFHIYDPNFPGTKQYISFDGVEMGDYPLSSLLTTTKYHILTNDVFQLVSVSNNISNIFNNISKTTPSNISGSLSGSFTVTLPSYCSGETGEWQAQLTQQCNTITGSLSVPGLFSTPITGTWDGTNLTWSGTGQSGITFSGVFDGKTISGSWSNGPACRQNGTSLGNTSGSFTGSRP
jgi:hypothetical protein